MFDHFKNLDFSSKKLINENRKCYTLLDWMDLHIRNIRYIY